MNRPLTGAQRLELIERDAGDHSKSLTAHNEALRDHGLRITAIEEARRMRALEEVRREEREEARHTALTLKLNTLQSDITSIKGGWFKFAWIVITIVAGLIITFALRGGGFAPG